MPYRLESHGSDKDMLWGQVWSRPALFVANAALLQEVRRSLQGAPPR
jgi:hypothetical protein